MEIEWTEPAIDDMAALDKGIARRVGDFRVRFHCDGKIAQVLRVRNGREAYR